jgi:hypothetical protein
MIYRPNNPMPLFEDGNAEAVYAMFVRYAEQARKAGRERYSARTIGERIRWECSVTDGGGDYKLNDHLWPDFARRLVAERPEFADFFEFRRRP